VEHEQAAHAAEAASGAFESWIQARTATTDPRQDPEVLAHTRELERLKGTEHLLQGEIDALDRQATVLDQQSAALNEAQARLEAAARPAAERARFVQEARVFGLRLAITLPMLLLAVWLVVKKRSSDYRRWRAALRWRRCSCSLWNWCPICPRMAAMCAMRWGSCSPFLRRISLSATCAPIWPAAPPPSSRPRPNAAAR
jgi:hypothetical protein